MTVLCAVVLIIGSVIAAINIIHHPGEKAFTIVPINKIGNTADTQKLLKSLVLNGPITESEVGGYEITLRLYKGPYFAGELIPAEVTYTNHTAQQISLTNTTMPGFCSNPIYIEQLQRSASQFALPEIVHSCPAMRGSPLEAGKTFIARQWLVLPASGQVAIRVKIGQVGAPDLFEDHWPLITLDVAAGPTNEQTLAIHIDNQQIIFEGSNTARSHLLYRYLCTESGGTTQGRIDWSLLATDITDLGIPQCGQKELMKGWEVLISAPGYKVIKLPQN